jgi:hypothetical protein
MAKAYCREVVRILRTLKAKRDMSVNEARLIVSIEDPRTREQRQLGIEVCVQQCGFSFLCVLTSWFRLFDCARSSCAPCSNSSRTVNQEHAYPATAAWGKLTPGRLLCALLSGCAG